MFLFRVLVEGVKKNAKLLTHVFEFCRVPCHGKRCEDRCNLVRQLTDSNIPCVVFETDVENELWRNGIDGGVVDPSLDGKGESRQPEVGSSGEEDVCDDAVGSTLPFCTMSASESEVMRG